MTSDSLHQAYKRVQVPTNLILSKGSRGGGDTWQIVKIEIQRLPYIPKNQFCQLPLSQPA